MSHTFQITRRSLLINASIGAAGLALLPLAHAFAAQPSGGMAMRRHPRTGTEVSALGLGCMRLPMLPQATFPRGPEIDHAAATRLVDHALAHGVNYFDTAYFYHRGQSEPTIGSILSRHPRDSYHLATKMPTPLVDSLDKAKAIFDEQLRRCQTGYFDFYQLHGIKSVSDCQNVYEKMGVLDYLLEEREKGRIRHLGWSFHGDAPALEYLLAMPARWDYAMLQLNYHDLLHKYNPSPQEVKAYKFPDQPAPSRWMYEKTRDAGIPIVVMEPLLGGRLARLGKVAAQPLRQRQPNWSDAAWAFRYAAELPGVLTVLSGMTHMPELEENIRTFSTLNNLDEEDMRALNAALELYVSLPRNRCTGCGYCMPCPYGVDIPAIFEHQNEHAHMLEALANPDSPDHARQRRVYLTDYGRSVADLRQASMCTGCGKCLKACPAMIDIPAGLRDTARLVEKLRSEAAA